MNNGQGITQAVVVSVSNPRKNAAFEYIALFDEEGNPIGLPDGTIDGGSL